MALAQISYGSDLLLIDRLGLRLAPGMLRDTLAHMQLRRRAAGVLR
ncbi:hypothetical protein Misp03_83650 [Microbispora sp. NBRC 16548]|nr:hypothetical protein Misp03_83650 [Microbispora sp. NBRC 16548]